QARDPERRSGSYPEPNKHLVADREGQNDGTPRSSNDSDPSRARVLAKQKRLESNQRHGGHIVLTPIGTSIRNVRLVRPSAHGPAFRTFHVGLLTRLIWKICTERNSGSPFTGVPVSRRNAKKFRNTAPRERFATLSEVAPGRRLLAGNAGRRVSS